MSKEEFKVHIPQQKRARTILADEANVKADGVLAFHNKKSEKTLGPPKELVAAFKDWERFTKSNNDDCQNN